MTTPVDTPEADRYICVRNGMAIMRKRVVLNHAEAAAHEFVLASDYDRVCSALTTSEQRVTDLEKRMTLARTLLTKGNPTPECNWGVLDVSQEWKV
jgi:hypothetical protein